MDSLDRIIRIFHSERHTIFRQGVRNIVRDQPIEIIGDADNINDTLNGLSIVKPTLLLIAHRLYDGEATDFLPLVKQKFPEIKILMLTMLAEKPYMLICLKYIDGMISKAASKEEVVKAINIVANGGFYYSSTSSSKLFENV